MASSSSSALIAAGRSIAMEPYSSSSSSSQVTCNVSSPVQDSEDFDPQPRDRCNSWPLQKSSRSSDFAHHTSPLIHEEIPEEGSDSGSTNDLTVDHHHLQRHHHHLHAGIVNSSAELLPSTLNTGGVNDFSAGKRSSSRRNAWGNLSYADLITQAILSAPDKRLTLSQIYDWMVKNVPYFRDKGDSNSSAGWKNSIRHNLSLHSRFMRIQNEGPGKSSWWVIDPDAKPGKSSRRRAGSMEISKKLEKKRGRVRKKMEQLRSINGGQLAADIGVSQPAAVGGQLTVLSPSMSESSDFLDGGGGGPSSMISFSLSSANDFRNRSNSAVSSYSLGTAGGHLSPKFESHFEDWVDDVQSLHVASSGAAELVESMSHSMNLVEPPPPSYTSASGASSTSSGRGFLFSAVDDDGPATAGGQQHRASPAKYLVVNSQQQQQHRHPRMTAGILSTSTQGLSPPSLGTTKNPVLYQSSGLKASSAPAANSDQPLPQYRDLFGASSQHLAPLPSNSSSSNSGRILRQVLTKVETGSSMLLDPNGSDASSSSSSSRGVMMLGADQQQSSIRRLHQPTMLPCSSFSIAQDVSAYNNQQPSLLLSNGQLPTELSEIMYDTEIQCDIDQVIRHELNIAGNLDFSADNFGNI